MSGAAAGLGALGFWIFIAAIIVAGIWYDARRKESQQETLRRVVESGREIDPALVDRVTGASDSRSMERDLRVAALIVLAAAPGLFLLGVFLGYVDAAARMAVIGASMLAGCVGAGLYLAARMIERRYVER